MRVGKRRLHWQGENFRVPSQTLHLKKDPFSRLISSILRKLPGKSDMFFLQIWWLQKAPGNIFRQTWHLSTAHLPPSVRDHRSGLHLYFPSRPLDFLPCPFYGATGQDSILRNNKLTKHRVLKIDSVWHRIKSTCSKQRKQTLKGDAELHRALLIQREQGVQWVQKQVSGLEIFPPQMYEVKRIISAGFNCSEKNDEVSMQVGWESGNNEHTNPNYNCMKRTLAELIENSAKPTKGWWPDKIISKMRNVGWSALSSCVESLFLTEDDLSRKKTAPDSCSETVSPRAKRFWRSCSTSMSYKSGREFLWGKKLRVLRVETIFI